MHDHIATDLAGMLAVNMRIEDCRKCINAIIMAPIWHTPLYLFPSALGMIRLMNTGSKKKRHSTLFYHEALPSKS